MKEEMFTPRQTESFALRVRACAANHGVQIRFAAMMVATDNYETRRRGAAMVAYISDRKTEYRARFPAMLTGGDVIIDQDHFTAFILGEV